MTKYVADKATAQHEHGNYIYTLYVTYGSVPRVTLTPKILHDALCMELVVSD